MTSPEAHLDALFDNLPDDPQERLDAVSNVYSLMRERAIKHLQPTIRNILQHASGLNYEEKVRVSRKINHALQDARLAIADPVTEAPSSLLPNRPRPTSHVSRFYLRDSRHDAEGKRHTMLLKPQTASALTLIALPSAEEKSPSR